jgi:hypothetical protein
MLTEVGAALWQGALLLLALLVIFAGVYLAVYFASWGSRPHWFEAFRDRFKLRYLLDNRFWPWIHQDTKYWVARLRFDRGPVVVAGRPSACRYWSLSYYPAEEFNTSIDTQSVRLDGEGRFRITLGQGIEDSEEAQNIRVDDGVTRGVIELRITLPDVDEPIRLPDVYQNDTLLVEEAEI